MELRISHNAAITEHEAYSQFFTIPVGGINLVRT